MNRRRMLQLLVQGGGLLTAAVVGIPALVAALFPVWRVRGEVWRPVGRIEEFPVEGVKEAVVGVPREDWGVSLREKGVYVWRPSDEDVVVFSRNCTDLSCPVTWDPGSEWFYCPCHGGVFAMNGDRMAGPPKRPLYRYANRVRDGLIEIDLNSLPPMT